MKIYFLVPEDELPQDQFDRKALDIEAANCKCKLDTRTVKIS